MPKLTIQLTDKTLKALREYLEVKYPGKYATSLIVEQAIREFLERQEEGR